MFNIFGTKETQEEPLYKSNYMGFWINVYPNRVEFKSGAGRQSMPINQIASVQLAMMGIMKITLESTGGKKYDIPTLKKKEVQQAIYDAQARFTGSNQIQSSGADELEKLSALKDKGIITQEEFDQKKKQLLGL